MAEQMYRGGIRPCIAHRAAESFERAGVPAEPDDLRPARHGPDQQIGRGDSDVNKNQRPPAISGRGAGGTERRR